MNSPQDEHGHDHEFTIIVNARPKKWSEREISFDQVVALAYDGKPPQGQYIVFTVTYSRGHGDKPEGILSKGESVKVKEGMIFNVAYTDKS